MLKKYNITLKNTNCLVKEDVIKGDLSYPDMRVLRIYNYMGSLIYTLEDTPHNRKFLGITK